MESSQQAGSLVENGLKEPCAAVLGSLYIPQNPSWLRTAIAITDAQVALRSLNVIAQSFQGNARWRLTGYGS